MARLQTLYLPDDGGYAFILDQLTIPPTITDDAAGIALTERWNRFAELCGAKGLMATPETIEIIDPFGGVVEAEIVDDEPEPLTVASLGEFLRHVVGEISFVDSEEEWTNPDVGGCGTTLNVHKHDDCPADDDTWCIIHYPMPGPWDGWPRWFDEDRMIMTRVCPHGIAHPTPEEYARGFDGEHECDGCLCSPDTVLTVVTRLKGSAPSPEEIKAFLDQHERNQAAEARLLHAIFPEATAEQAAGAFDTVDAPTADEIAAGVVEKIRKAGGLHLQLEDVLTEREKRIRTLAGIPDGEPIPQAQATFTAIDREGRPTGEPVTVPAAGITITQREYVDPIFGRAENFPSDDQLATEIAKAPISGDWTPVAQPTARRCGAESGRGTPCVKEHGHPYLHDFAMPERGIDSPA